MAAGLPIHPADHLVGVSLVEPGSHLVEDAQRGLGVLPRLLVMLPREVHFGVVQESQALEMYVPDRRRHIQAAAEVAVCIVPELAVCANHAKVVVGDSTPTIIGDALESGQ